MHSLNLISFLSVIASWPVSELRIKGVGETAEWEEFRGGVYRDDDDASLLFPWPISFQSCTVPGVYGNEWKTVTLPPLPSHRSFILSSPLCVRPLQSVALRLWSPLSICVRLSPSLPRPLSLYFRIFPYPSVGVILSLSLFSPLSLSLSLCLSLSMYLSLSLSLSESFCPSFWVCLCPSAHLSYFLWSPTFLFIYRFRCTIVDIPDFGQSSSSATLSILRPSGMRRKQRMDSLTVGYVINGH